MLASQSRSKENYINTYWEVWEKKGYIKEVTLKLLYKEDPKRAEKLAISSLEHLLQYLNKRGCKDEQLNTKVCQSDFKMRQYGSYATRIHTLYTFLTLHEVNAFMDRLLTLSHKKINDFFKASASNKMQLDKAYLKFYMKYADPEERQELMHRSKAFLEKMLFETDWQRYWSSRDLRGEATKIHTLIISLEGYMPEYISLLRSRILDSDQQFIHWVAE